MTTLGSWPGCRVIGIVSTRSELLPVVAAWAWWREEAPEAVPLAAAGTIHVSNTTTAQRALAEPAGDPRPRSLPDNPGIGRPYRQMDDGPTEGPSVPSLSPARCPEPPSAACGARRA
jgi:hypothetical protein